MFEQCVAIKALMFSQAISTFCLKEGELYGFGAGQSLACFCLCIEFIEQ